MRRMLGISVVVTSMLAVSLSVSSAVPAAAISAGTNHAAGTVSWAQTDFNGAPPVGGPFSFEGVFTAGGATYTGAAVTTVAVLGEGADPLPVFHLILTSVPPGGLIGDCTTLFVDPPGAPVLNLIQGLLGLLSSLLGLSYALNYGLQFTCSVHMHGGPAATLSWTNVAVVTSSVGNPRDRVTMTLSGLFAG